MKILFEFSRSGLPGNEENYEAIREAILRQGHTLTNDLLKSSKGMAAPLPENVYSRLAKSISQADCVIIEGTIVSLSLGYVLTESLNKGKPVLFLSCGPKPQNRFSWSIKSKLLTNQSYHSIKDLEAKLANYFSTNEFVKTRFNLVLPNALNSFVLKKSRDNNISKTEYILSLLKKEMQKD